MCLGGPKLARYVGRVVILCYIYVIWLILNNSDVVFTFLLCGDVMRLNV
jgi:hypothetical protein